MTICSNYTYYPFNMYKLQISPSNRALCCNCREKIKKNSLRLRNVTSKSCFCKKCSLEILKDIEKNNKNGIKEITTEFEHIKKIRFWLTKKAIDYKLCEKVL